MREMKANRLQKGTTIIELDRLELADLQEMLDLVQSYNSKFKEKDRLQPRHYGFIKRLNLQLEGSQQELIAADKLQILKDRLKEALHRSPERDKSIYDKHHYYYWDIGFDPEKDFGIKINDCRGLIFYLSIGVNIGISEISKHGCAQITIRPNNDTMADSKYIDLDHQATIKAALAGKSYLLKYLKEQILAYMAAKSEAVKL
jgi:hypothetical protein